MTEQSACTQVRTLTTGRTYFPVLPARSNGFSGLRAVPWIRLKGVWLEEAGFAVGKPVRVEVRRGQVTIWLR
ncbi:type I toxin-antitoxin system SymE family toxin [Cupriavidus necator]|uniref:Type I toxin-antitoxin system SymE family toxin n=1 Tax=Cupriavidus necator TaxID=106590 RepID=A0A2P1DUZ4_CUPNE|nr:type I toxin-antitoxin system SymE family toxin [Cupriavidus necator]